MRLGLRPSMAHSGCIVTIDAMGCQKKIAEKIIDKKAGYILALKENQKSLYTEVTELFEHVLAKAGKEAKLDY